MGHYTLTNDGDRSPFATESLPPIQVSRLKLNYSPIGKSGEENFFSRRAPVWQSAYEINYA